MSKTLTISAIAQNGKALIRIVGRISDWRNNSEDFEIKVNDLIAQGIRDVELYIKSEGGSCIEANEIVNIIRKFPGTITGNGGALVASAASYIAVHCSSFSMPTNGLFMIHKPMVYTEGNMDQLESDVKMLKTLTDVYREAYVKKTGKTAQQIDQLWLTDFWMGSQEAKQLGFIDTISDEEDQIDDDTIQAVKAYQYKNLPKALMEFPLTKNQNTPDMNIKAIAVALALTESVTEAEVMAALSTLKAKADKADEYKQQLETLQQEHQKEKIKALLDKAIEDRKVLPAQREHLENLASKDFAAVEAIIKASPAAAKVSGQIETGANQVEDRSQWKYQDYMDKDPQSLITMAKDDLSTFKRLFKEHYGTDYTE
ncbi:MAG TPA: ATP-dependent Clp protease proteolytic subunit [Bacteroidales bacterium]|nr:ATP-dependent Clp protease proteolytic subunit [Bacteroidales bacterium]HSA43587.1 ATP-dependent Clp protease proteolytic subunit [Bacteroidales bacterium]